MQQSWTQPATPDHTQQPTLGFTTDSSDAANQQTGICPRCGGPTTSWVGDDKFSSYCGMCAYMQQ